MERTNYYSRGMDNIKGMEVVNGRIWVTNAGSMNGAPGDTIIRFDTNGSNLGFIDTAGESSFDIVDAGNGEVYISYINTATKIERRDYDGNILGNIVNPGVKFLFSKWPSIRITIRCMQLYLV